MILCPHCDAELAHPASCGSCGRLLEIPEVTTPYAVLGLGHTNWAVDRDSLRKRLLKLTRDVHPDFFGTAGADVRALAERNSARINDAYAILSDDVTRADWLVGHLGGPDEQTERAMPPEFLAEVLEWNELLEEAQESEPLDPRLEALEKELCERRAAALAAVGELLTPLPERESPDLKRVRAQLNAVRYVDRALSQIATQRLARAGQS